MSKERRDQHNEVGEGTEHQPQGGDPNAPLDEPTRADYDRVLEELEILRREQERLLRTAADAQNEARKARQEVHEARHQAVTGVVRDVSLSLDHFDMALAHDPEKATARQVIEGVRSIRDELIRVLCRHGIGLIQPAPNEPFDPGRHAALSQQPAEGIEPGHVVEVFQVGYTLGDRVIRPAKVAVAPGETAETTAAEPQERA